MKKFISICKEFGKQLKDDNVNAYAGSCAFFVFLSLIPVIIVILAILPYTPVSESDLLSFFDNLLPDFAMSIISGMISEVYDKSIGIISVSAIAALWSAGKGFNSLVYGLNAIEHYSEKRNGFLVRLFSTIYTVMMLAAIILLLVIMVYGGIAVDIIVGYFPYLANLMELFMILRTLVMIVIMTFVFVLLYAFLPSKRRKFIYHLPGAAFTAFSWTIFSYVFFLYVDATNAFSMYGSLTLIVILLMWLYFLMYLVLFGANINKYLRPFVKAYNTERKERKKDRSNCDTNVENLDK